MDIEKTFETYDVITCEPFHHPDHKKPTATEKLVIDADTVEQGYAFSNCADDLYILELVIQLYYPEYYDDYVKYGGESGARAAGALRPEGKEYEMKDGDVVEFMFSK